MGHAVTVQNGGGGKFCPVFSSPVVNTTNTPKIPKSLSNYLQSDIMPSMSNYYHKSPTIQQLKDIKALRAAEMKKCTDAMKAISAKYADVVATLEHQRSMEIDVAGHIKQGRFSDEQIAVIDGKIKANHAKLARKVAKFTGANDISS